MSEEDSKISIGDYNAIMSDRSIFNKTVYTPLSEALRLLEERQKDPVLMAKIEKLLNGDIPEVLRNKKCGIFARQIATPNYDTQCFIKLTKENKLETVLFEYLEDKLTSNNVLKHSLGQIRVNNGLNKKGDYLIEKNNIINFSKYDGKKIKDIMTLWGEPLIDFHRKLFKYYKLPDDIIFHDMSGQFNKYNNDVSKYYINFFLLFISHGILFENFLISKDSEGDFTKKILLPTIERIMNLTGLKPLIVPIEPLESENSEYWISHPSKIRNIIPIK